LARDHTLAILHFANLPLANLSFAFCLFKKKMLILRCSTCITWRTHTSSPAFSTTDYCDRWCERCSFIDRCATGVMEQKRWAKGKDWEPEDFFEELKKIFPFTENKMAEWLEENDIDPKEFEENYLPEPDLKGIKEMAKEMQNRGMDYYKSVSAFFKQNQDSFKAKGVDLFSEQEEPEGKYPLDRSLLADAVDVVRWYMHFMFAKGSRAVQGMEDMHETWGGPYQSDALGSAKIALIAAERSIAAWEIIRRHLPEHSAAIVGGFELQLERFRHRIEGLFPDCRKFVRPGFDTEPKGGGAAGLN